MVSCCNPCACRRRARPDAEESDAAEFMQQSRDQTPDMACGWTRLVRKLRIRGDLLRKVYHYGVLGSHLHARPQSRARTRGVSPRGDTEGGTGGEVGPRGGPSYHWDSDEGRYVDGKKYGSYPQSRAQNKRDHLAREASKESSQSALALCLAEPMTD